MVELIFGRNIGRFKNVRGFLYIFIADYFRLQFELHTKLLEGILQTLQSGELDLGSDSLLYCVTLNLSNELLWSLRYLIFKVR